MIGALPLRDDPRAFSAFYGAFAVLLAATLVVGAIATVSLDDGSHDGARGDRLAHALLDTLLASSVPPSNITGGQALSVMCFAPTCEGTVRAEAFLAWLGEVAQSVAAPLGIRFLLVLSAPQVADQQAGSLEPRPGLAMSQAEVYNPGIANFAALTIFLELP